MTAPRPDARARGRLLRELAAVARANAPAFTIRDVEFTSASSVVVRTARTTTELPLDSDRRQVVHALAETGLRTPGPDDTWGVLATAEHPPALVFAELLFDVGNHAAVLDDTEPPLTCRRVTAHGLTATVDVSGRLFVLSLAPRQPHVGLPHTFVSWIVEHDAAPGARIDLT